MNALLVLPSFKVVALVMRLLALRSQSPTKTERYDMMAGLQQHTFHFATLARTHPKILDESHLLLSGIRRNQANSHCFLSSSVVHSLTEKKNGPPLTLRSALAAATAGPIPLCFFLLSLAHCALCPVRERERRKTFTSVPIFFPSFRPTLPK